MTPAPRGVSQLPSLSTETSLVLQLSLYTRGQRVCAMAFLCQIWHVPKHAAPPTLRSQSGTSKAPAGVPVAHLMPGLCLMTCIPVALNGMETSAQELRPEQSVVTPLLTDGSFSSEWDHPGTEPPTRAPSQGQNKIKLISSIFFQPPTLFQAVTGCASSGINSLFRLPFKDSLGTSA